MVKLLSYTSPLKSLAIFPDGKRAISGSSDGKVIVWSLDGGQVLMILEGHTNEVNKVTFSADGRWIVSVSEDASLKIWDPGTGNLLCTLLGHAKGVNCVTILPDGKRAMSGGSDNQVRLWDLDSRESKALFVDNSPIHHIEVSKDSRWLACSNTGGLIWLFEWIQ